MTNVLPDREYLTQPIAHRRYTPAVYDVNATAILRPDETLILADPNASGDIVPLMRLLQDPPTGNPPPLPPQPKPKTAAGVLRRAILPEPITGPETPPTNPPKPSPPPPPADWRPAHRRPAPMWAYAVAGVGLALATYSAGWVSCWAVAL